MHIKALCYDRSVALSDSQRRGRRPRNPAKGVPPFETLLRALRGRESAVKGKIIFKNRLSRAQGWNNFYFSPCYII